VTWLQAGKPSNRGSILSKDKRHIFSELFIPDLVPHEYGEIFPRSKGGRGVKLTTHLQSVPRLNAETTTFLDHMPSWRA